MKLNSREDLINARRKAGDIMKNEKGCGSMS